MIPLVEVFHSVQGEGTNVGSSAIFIRFGGCNLDCHFADGSVCDTPWKKPTLRMDLEDLEAQIRTFGWNRERLTNPWIILTGGEPTAAPMFERVVERFWSSHRIAVETNGTRWRDALNMVDHICVSPKNLPGINHGLMRVNANPQERVLALAKELRFVITGRHDPVPRLRPICKDDVDLFVSPALLADGMGQEHEKEDIPEFVPGALVRCLEIVMEDPRWRLSLQTHKWARVR